MKENNTDVINDIICIKNVLKTNTWLDWFATIIITIFPLLMLKYGSEPISALFCLLFLLLMYIGKTTTARTKFYLAVDNDKTLYGYTLQNEQKKIEFSYYDTDIAKIDIYAGFIRVFWHNGQYALIEFSKMFSKKDLTKLKTILLQHYPDKVPEVWHTEKDIRNYIEKGVLPSSLVIVNPITIAIIITILFAMILAILQL